MYILRTLAISSAFALISAVAFAGDTATSTASNTSTNSVSQGSPSANGGNGGTGGNSIAAVLAVSVGGSNGGDGGSAENDSKIIVKQYAKSQANAGSCNGHSKKKAGCTQ